MIERFVLLLFTIGYVLYKLFELLVAMAIGVIVIALLLSL